jgi:hypothetical protein
MAAPLVPGSSFHSFKLVLLGESRHDTECAVPVLVMLSFSADCYMRLRHLSAVQYIIVHVSPLSLRRRSPICDGILELPCMAHFLHK